jgi:hypothetical protein
MAGDKHWNGGLRWEMLGVQEVETQGVEEGVGWLSDLRTGRGAEGGAGRRGEAKGSGPKARDRVAQVRAARGSHRTHDAHDALPKQPRVDVIGSLAPTLGEKDGDERSKGPVPSPGPCPRRATVPSAPPRWE